MHTYCSIGDDYITYSYTYIIYYIYLNKIIKYKKKDIYYYRQVAYMWKRYIIAHESVLHITFFHFFVIF